MISSEARAETFGYECHRCMSCCRNMTVPVDPYESARIARRPGISTSQFRRDFTAEGTGTVLKSQQTGDCVFLGESDCTVYSDRPLACRLYPLCREITPDDREIFTRLDPKPTSSGVYTRDGTIEEFLTKQDVAPYIRASDEYYEWYWRAVEFLEETGGEARPAAALPALARNLLDMDTAVAAYCAARHIAEPRDIEERKAIHILTLNDALDHHPPANSGGTA